MSPWGTRVEITVGHCHWQSDAAPLDYVTTTTHETSAHPTRFIHIRTGIQAANETGILKNALKTINKMK